MKSVLLSIRPEWVAKILNGQKTIEIRKKFPKDYVGWIDLYCTKGEPYLVNDLGNYVLSYNHEQWTNSIVNGKVVARFWCDKVEEIELDKDFSKIDETVKYIIGKAGLSLFQAFDYLQGNNGYAIHISKLKVFDRPRELYLFEPYCSKYPEKSYCEKRYCHHCRFNGSYWGCNFAQLTKAPSTYCYIESEE